MDEKYVEEFRPNRERFVEAFAHTSHVVMGRKLGKFTLYQRFWLEAMRSPTVVGGEITAIDLELASRVCSAPYGKVHELVESYIKDYSKGDGEQYIPVERIESILDNATLLLALPKQFDIRTEKEAFRKQYAKHISQMCKFIRISYKEFNKAAEVALEEE